MAETAEQKLNRYEYVIDAQMAEIDKLRAENQRLLDWIMGDADAHKFASRLQRSCGFTGQSDQSRRG